MHPVYDSAALQAQRRRDEIDGHLNTHYAGAYWGYGFHEDAVQSALTTTRRLLARTAQREAAFSR